MLVPILLLSALQPPADAAPQAKPTAVAEPQLRDELLAMEKSDQGVREEFMRFLRDHKLELGRPIDPELMPQMAALSARMQAADAKNRKRLKEMVAEHGWPTIPLVGKAASKTAFLIAQHADDDRPFQKETLDRLRTLPAGAVERQGIAYLTDRILVGEGQKQRFGTQLTGSTGGAPTPAPIEDPDHVDARRAEYGLPPLAEYLAEAKKAMGADQRSQDTPPDGGPR